MNLEICIEVGYSLKDVYHILAHREKHDNDSHSNLIWNKPVPLEVFLLVKNYEQEDFNKLEFGTPWSGSLRFFVVFMSLQE